MYKLLGGLKDYFKLQEVQTDNAVFRLHNLFTTVLLLACSLIITATQYVGQPISCIVNGIPTHVVNTFCWISSTFTMPDAFQRHVSWAFYLNLFKKNWKKRNLNEFKPSFDLICMFRTIKKIRIQRTQCSECSRYFIHCSCLDTHFMQQYELQLIYINGRVSQRKIYSCNLLN